MDSLTLATVSKALEKIMDRNAVGQGVQHRVVATVTARVDDKPAETVQIEADVSVGFDRTTAAFVIPDVKGILAYMAELIDLAYGPTAAQEIMDNVVSAYQANKAVPVSPEYASRIQAFTRRMQESKDQVSRGAISVKVNAVA